MQNNQAKKCVFTGSCVALITPFKNGEVDYKSLEKLINHQLQNKTDAILVLGTTGEPSTMTTEEKQEVIKFSKKIIGSKAKFIVGTGGNNTKKVVEDSLFAKSQGADALLIVTPYYNKCTQNGLIKHYEEISNKVDLPIICYNVPGRTGLNIAPETAVKLSEIKNMAGIKEASGNISQIVTLAKLVKGKMALYSGDDSLNYLVMALGGQGSISVTANALPREVKFVADNCLSGKFAEGLAMHEKLLDINKNLFVEVNPIPIKYACSLLGLCDNELRMPLTELEDKNKPCIENSLKELGIKI